MQRFRTATPMGDWRSFKFTNSYHDTMEEGQLYFIEDTVGVLLLDIQYDSSGCKKDKEIEEDDEGVHVYHIEKLIVDKVTTTGSAFLPGDKVYWSGTAGDPVTPTYDAQTAPYWIGICVQAAAETDDEVMIDLKGDKVSLTEPL